VAPARRTAPTVRAFAIALLAVLTASCTRSRPVDTAAEPIAPPPATERPATPVFPEPPRVPVARPVPSTPPAPAPAPPPPLRAIRGNVSLGRGEATGGADAIVVERVDALVRGQLGGITSCYERALRNNPALAGRLDARFTLSESGRASVVEVRGLSEAPEVGMCIASAIRRLAFPQPAGGTVVFTFPFTVTPGG
jgi:hypothetical protein